MSYVEASVSKQALLLLYAFLSDEKQLPEHADEWETHQSQLDDELDDDEVAECSGMLNAVIAIKSALQTLQDPSVDSAFHAATCALDAIDNVAPEADDGIEEAEAWQKAALQAVKGWEAPSTARALFEEKEQPVWLEQYA